jgi:hypothetical protein
MKHSPFPRIVVPSFLAVAVLLATACGDDTPAGSSSATPSSDVILQVSHTGGFVAPVSQLSTTPSVTVLADGTIITPAPTIAIYPGPAIASLQQVRVDPSIVTGLVAKARTLGLLQDSLDFGQPAVADATTAVIVIRADGHEYRHEAYALGMSGVDGLGAGAGEGATDKPIGGGPTPALTAEQSKNRTALNSLVQAASALPPGMAAWTPTQIAVYDLGPYSPDANLTQPSKPWPLSDPPPTGGTPAAATCTVIAGSDASALLTALATATQRTPWQIVGADHSLAFVPVVPGRAACA